MGLLDKLETKGNIPKKDKEQSPEKEFVTYLDKMYYQISEGKSIKLKNLAYSLKMPLKQTEEYAKLLDKQGLAKLYYPAFGSPVLKSIEQKQTIKAKNKNLRLVIFTIIVVVITAAIVYLLQKGLLVKNG